jgi:hypothetical protein
MRFFLAWGIIYFSNKVELYSNIMKQIYATPDSNTVSNRQVSECSTGLTAHLDYLVVVGQVSSVDEVQAALWAFSGSHFDWSNSTPRTIGIRYDAFSVCALGIQIAYRSLGASGLFSVRISIPGKPLSHAGFERVQALGKWFVAHDFGCTRFDWAIDDYERKLSLSDIRNSISEGGVSGARKYKYVESGDIGKDSDGTTIYLGSPRSDKMIRFYDKNAESGGELNCIRYELQARNSLANHYYLKYFSGEQNENIISEVSQMAVGSLKFIRPENEVLSRCPLCEWWAEFLGRIGGCIRVSISRLQTTIADKIHWVQRSVGATLAIIAQVKGWGYLEWFLDSLVREKTANLKPRQDAYIATVKDRLAVNEGTFDDYLNIATWGNYRSHIAPIVLPSHVPLSEIGMLI